MPAARSSRKNWVGLGIFFVKIYVYIFNYAVWECTHAGIPPQWWQSVQTAKWVKRRVQLGSDPPRLRICFSVSYSYIISCLVDGWKSDAFSTFDKSFFIPLASWPRPNQRVMAFSTPCTERRPVTKCKAFSDMFYVSYNPYTPDSVRKRGNLQLLLSLSVK